MVTRPVSVRESLLKGFDETFALAFFSALLAGVTGLLLIGVVPDLIVRLGPPGATVLFGTGLVLLVANHADGVVSLGTNVAAVYLLHAPGAVLLVAGERLLTVPVLSTTDPGVVWWIATPVAALSSVVSFVLVQSVPRRFRLTDEGVVTVDVLGRNSEPLPYDEIEVVVRSQTIAHPLTETATYELVRRGGHNRTMTAVTDPAAVEEVFETVVDPPRLQRRRATEESDDYYFWLLWPDDCDPPEGPVVDVETVEERVDAPIGDVDLNALDAAVAADDLDNLGDVGDVDVGDGFDADVDSGIDTDAGGDVGGGGFDVDDI